jgi:hypothetical protein
MTRRGPRAVKKTALLLLVMLWSGSARGEDLELVTDRPDQTESSAVVPPGLVQIEMGWTREVEDGDLHARSDAMPALLGRIGVARRLELRLGHDGYTWESGFEPEAEGLGDAGIGVKVKLWDEGPGWRPDAALIAGTTLPTGEDGFSSERADPAFRFALSHTVSERVSVGYNLGAAWASAPDEAGTIRTESSFEYTATVGFGLTERFGSFIEVFGEAPLSSGAPDAGASLDGGLTFLALPNAQLDAAAGVGLSDGASDWFYGLGASVRIPR